MASDREQKLLSLFYDSGDNLHAETSHLSTGVVVAPRRHPGGTRQNDLPSLLSPATSTRLPERNTREVQNYADVYCVKDSCVDSPTVSASAPLASRQLSTAFPQTSGMTPLSAWDRWGPPSSQQTPATPLWNASRYDRPKTIPGQNSGAQARSALTDPHNASKRDEKWSTTPRLADGQPSRSLSTDTADFSLTGDSETSENPSQQLHDPRPSREFTQQSNHVEYHRTSSEDVPLVKDVTNLISTSKALPSQNTPPPAAPGLELPSLNDHLSSSYLSSEAVLGSGICHKDSTMDGSSSQPNFPSSTEPLSAFEPPRAGPRLPRAFPALSIPAPKVGNLSVFQHMPTIVASQVCENQSPLEKLRSKKMVEVRLRNENKQDRNNTASLKTLRSIRSAPLSDEEHKGVAAKVERYRSIGESPANAVVLDSDSYSPVQEDPAPQASHRDSHACMTMASSTQRGGDASSNRLIEREGQVNKKSALGDGLDVSILRETQRQGDLATECGNSLQVIVDEEDEGQGTPAASLVLNGGGPKPMGINWDRRPCYDNDSPDYINRVNSWTAHVAQRTIAGLTDYDFRVQDQNKLVGDVDSWVADGLGLVPRTQTIGEHNATYYGYRADIAECLPKDCPITQQQFDEEVTVNVNDPSNQPILEETTEFLVQTFLAHRKKLWSAPSKAPSQERPPTLESNLPRTNATQIPSHTPQMNIYLRPAVKADIEQLTWIYNWHIENGPRTSELEPIDVAAMDFRFSDVIDNKFPFIVAVKKIRSKRGNRRLQDTSAPTPYNHPIKNFNADYNAIVEAEEIVGWACAQDYVVSTACERLTAELELYVAPKARRNGVGKCLMDKLLHACDRGHVKRGKYDFKCATEEAALYQNCGGRDMHKLYFIVRDWTTPGSVSTRDSLGKAKANQQGEHQEAEDSGWLWRWLESWDFQIEARLVEAGARQGRYIDLIHFGRKTAWQPREGEIPEPE